MNIPNYPDDFFSFKDGYHISDETINTWIKECIEYLETNQNANCTGRSSGDTRVDVSRCGISDMSDEYYYDVDVSQNYLHKDVYITE